MLAKLLVAASLCFSLSAYASFFGKIEQKVQNNQNNPIDWKHPNHILLENKVDQKTGSVQVYAKIEGTLKNKNANVLLNDQSISTVNGLFEVNIMITDKTTDFEITLIDLEGKISNSQYQITIEEWEEQQLEIKNFQKKPLLGLNAMLGGVHYNYQQTQINPSSQSSLVAKAGFTRSFTRTSKFDYSLSLFFSFVPLAFQGDSLVENNLQFFGANVRSSYLLPWIKRPWSFRMAVGWYYLTMLGAQSFGFQNLNSLQLYPTLSYTFEKLGRVGVYFKVSPILNQFQFLDSSNYEIAAGTHYSYPWKEWLNLLGSLDISRIRVNVNSLTMDNFSVSLSFGVEI